MLRQGWVMMGATVGVVAGKGLLSSSFYYSDLTDNYKLSYITSTTEHHHHSNFNSHSTSNSPSTSTSTSTKNVIIAKKTSSSSIKPLKECSDGSISLPIPQPIIHRSSTQPLIQDDDYDNVLDPETSLEALLLLHKSILENQLKLSFHKSTTTNNTTTHQPPLHITSSGIPARLRRISTRRKTHDKPPLTVSLSPDLIHNRFIGGYVRGLTTDELLTHAQVVNLSTKIQMGLSFEDHRSRLKERLGCEPSDEQLAMSLRMTCAELRSKLIECTLAREKLVMSNVRLVMSIAQKYENMGVDMSDLVQGGLIGLLRGIEKFDSSKGFKISTYVYWWIRQGVSRALVENSRTLRLPTHLHERLSLIRNAKNKLEEKGVTPSIDRIAECLNMSHKKIKNATEAIRSVLSLDREAFPSLNGMPGKTFHSYIADSHLENSPWHGVDEWALKDGVNNLIDTTLREREKDIIRLYYGLDGESLTWEEISKRIGLSRERIRQVGLVALEKLKHAARKRRMEALIIKH